MSGEAAEAVNGGSSATSRDASIAIVVVDEAKLTRDCLVQFLHASAPDFVIKGVGHCREAEAASFAPSAVVLNAKTYGFQDLALTEETAAMQAIWPGVPCLMFSESPAPPATALEAIRRGWQGYFPADQGMDLLIAAIRLIALGGIFIPAGAVEFCVSSLVREAP